MGSGPLRRGLRRVLLRLRRVLLLRLRRVLILRRPVGRLLAIPGGLTARHAAGHGGGGSGDDGRAGCHT